MPAAGKRPARAARESFPRLSARTRRFTLGEPRTITVSRRGDRVVFLRSQGPSDPVTCLWTLDPATGEERLVVDPARLLADPEDLPEAEARRRERARETAAGIVSYALDADGRRACFALGGQLFLAELSTGKTRTLASAGGVFDPRLDPTGRLVAYCAGGELRLTGPKGDAGVLAADADADVTWGLAEFVAAEEMGRSRGAWWSPDGRSIAAARVDNRPVQRWYVADPANPADAPAVLRYPAAGSANADVTLHVLAVPHDPPGGRDDPSGGRDDPSGGRDDPSGGRDDPSGGRDDPSEAARAARLPSGREVRWDRSAFPYLVGVDWSDGHPLTLTVQSRDQRSLVVMVADPDSGETEQRWRHDDPRWVELTPGAPSWWGDRLAVLVDRDGARRLVVDGQPLTPTDLQVRSVVGTLGDDLVVTGSEEPTETHVYRVDGEGKCRRVTSEPGVHAAVAGGDTMVITSTSMAWAGVRVSVLRDRGERAAETAGEIASLAARPGLSPKGRFWTVGDRKLRSVVLHPRPAAGVPDDRPLPVLLDPYGGPHAQRVVRARNAHLTSQWFADQGFAVVVIDGRGTPGRGPDWEREVWGDLAGPVLDDQVDGLEALAAHDERLDLTRVGIRGWSFGGYLAALAVLRRPDVFHAAVAGAPVTEWRLYDTHYTERYLGLPEQYPEHYERTSLLGDADRLTRPLLLIHGLADDNVVAAHTLRLSAELMAHGRPHQVLPLSGVTHMTPQEVVAENLLQLQVAFLREALRA